MKRYSVDDHVRLLIFDTKDVQSGAELHVKDDSGKWRKLTLGEHELYSLLDTFDKASEANR